MRETTREFIKGRINNSTVRPSVSNMTLSFTSQPLRQGKSLYVPVSSSTYLPFSYLFFSPLSFSLSLTNRIEEGEIRSLASLYSSCRRGPLLSLCMYSLCDLAIQIDTEDTTLTNATIILFFLFAPKILSRAN